jgi:hypothetical protein
MRGKPGGISMFYTILLFFYFFPTLLAWRLGCKSAFKIFLVNLLLGWTLLGWLWAVIWAAVERFGKPSQVAKLPDAPAGSTV